MTFPSKTAHLTTLCLVTFFKSVTRFGVILRVFGNFFGGYLVFCHNFEPALAKFVFYWANLNDSPLFGACQSVFRLNVNRRTFEHYRLQVQQPTSVTRKISPNVYKSWLKMISLEKGYILTPLQKVPKNVADLGKLIVAKCFKK